MTAVAANRLPLEQSKVMKIPPDWAIEGVSSGTMRREIERKLGRYLAFYVRSVWIAYPRERQVVIDSPGTDPQTFF